MQNPAYGPEFITDGTIMAFFLAREGVGVGTTFPKTEETISAHPSPSQPDMGRLMKSVGCAPTVD